MVPILDSHAVSFYFKSRQILFLFYVFLFFSGSLNCAAFMAGIVEAVLNGCNFVCLQIIPIALFTQRINLMLIFHNFKYSLALAILFRLQPAKVTAHWHKGTTFMIKFDESVIVRDKMVEGR